MRGSRVDDGRNHGDDARETPVDSSDAGYTEISPIAAIPAAYF